MNSKLTFILTCLISLNSFAQVSVGNTSLSEREVIGNLNIPWEIKWGHDDHIWMTERPGIVSRIDVETGSKQVLLDIQSLVFSDDWSEAGLLGMEFHPDFETNHILFLTYTFIEASSVKERLVAYTYNEAAQTLENEQILIDNINGYTTHTGSRIHNLNDYTILMSTGDAQDQSASQDVNALTGKFLRIDISEDNFGGVPADNPIPGSYIWSWGHRNAQGLELAPNGIIYSSEHGPTTDDELNILEPNRNFGWPDVQGFCNLPTETGFCAQNNVVEPLTAWTPTIAPSDIIWYDHPAIPEFQNTLLMTVLKNKMLVRFEFSEDGRTVTNQTEFFNNYWGRLRDICVSPNGKIYLATNGTSWPSQPPNEIIELSNTDYYNNLISGCTDSTATNYSNLANLDDGSCEWLDCENNLSNTSFTALVEDSVCHSNLYCEEWGWDGGDCVFDCNNDLMTIWDIDGYFYNGQCDQILNCMAYNFDNESCLEPQGCEDENGVSYDHGVQWSTDPCTLCSCDNGVIACATEACENLICDAPNYLENVQGQCCPVCIEVQPGCTDSNADNYNSTATDDDGSCIYYGCTDFNADNYAPLSNSDDGSCIYLGCTNSDYLEYWNYNWVSSDGLTYYYLLTPLNELVNQDDGSCNTQIVQGCVDPNFMEYNPQSNIFDMDLCQTIIVRGCMDETGFNYSIIANTDDGSCYPVIEGCMDQSAFNYVQPTGDVFVDINTNNNEMCVPVIYGCLDSLAYNFNDYDGDGEYNELTGTPTVDVNTDDGSCIARVYGCLDNDYVEYDDLANTDDGSCDVLLSVAYAEVTQQNINLNNTIEEATTSLSSLQQALDTWNTTIDLSAGWNIFGYGCPSSIDVADGLSNHTESIIITKDNNGNAYMPEFGFNGIGDFTPGYGYQIKLSEAIDSFSLCDWYVNDIPEDNIVSLQEENASLQEQNQILIDSILELNQNPLYEIGEYAEGGIVFYVDSTGEHGLVSTLENINATYEWGCYQIEVEGADGTAIGTGYQNTLDIDSSECQVSSVSGIGIIAAQAALDYESMGYNDWFLPTINELILLYNNLYSVYYYSQNTYWTSSSSCGNEAKSCFVNFSNGNIGGHNRDNLEHIIPIRSF